MCNIKITNVLGKAEVFELLHSILKERNLLNHELKISSGSNKGDGYQSYVTTVEVVGGNFAVIIKCAPQVEKFRKELPVRDLYLREIFFYEKIAKTFEKIQEPIENPFNVIPKCLSTVSDNCNEKVILENIKVQGYKLWNRKLEMDRDHIAFVFEQYGKFHAVSYVMRDQYPDEYVALTRNLTNIWSFFGEADNGFNKVMTQEMERVASFVGCDNDDVKSRIRDVSRKLGKIMIKSQIPGSNTVILHGDSWSNNMMFKYGDSKNPTKPTEMKFIDYQLVGNGTPIVDLAYFFYTAANKIHLDNLEDYQQIYYRSLSSYAKALGTDLDKYFPLDEFLNQWKKYCKLGFVMSVLLIKGMLREDDEIFDAMDVGASNVDFCESFGRNIKNEEAYVERIRNVALHMYDNKFI